MAVHTRNTATRRWGLLVLLTVLGAVAGVAYALIRAPEYTAKSYLAVVAENPGDTSAVSYAQAYSRIASQGDALQVAADASGGSASVEELRRGVLATASPDAPVIELTGTAGTAQRAADLVNLMANGLTKTANNHTADTRMRVALLSAAVPPADPTSPHLPLAVGVGAAVGFLLGGLAFLGRSPGNEPVRAGGPETTADNRLEPTEAISSPESNSLQRLTSWRRRAPANDVTPFTPMPQQPRPDRRDGAVVKPIDDDPKVVRDGTPAPPREPQGKQR